MALDIYRRKRRFTRTTEPRGRIAKSDRRRFVVQEHHASQLHYDFRLEMGGVLKSWAIPKGPSLNPRQKRLAVSVEDHPLAYLDYEGEIAEGNYGAGKVVIWDSGNYEPVESDSDPLEQLKSGKFSFRLRGDKLQGEFHLVRMEQRHEQWLLIKGKDEFADAGWKLKPLSSGDGRPSRRRAGNKKTVRKTATPSAKSAAQPASKLFRQKQLQGDVRVQAGSHVVSLTHLDKLYWPDEGYTKGDLLRYYFDISKTLLPYLKDRPLIMRRYPNGIKGQSFYQHDVDRVPHFVRTFSTEVQAGHRVDYVVCDNMATLLYTANFGDIAPNPWLSRVETLDHPDWIVFDLDPYRVEFSVVCEVALAVKHALDKLGLASYAKTSGATGIHVFVPIKPEVRYEQAAGFAERVAIFVAREHSDIATLERSKRTRKAGRVYVDYLQNARGKSIAAPYAVRARPGATVSAPLDWSEVKRKPVPQDFTLQNMPQRLKKKGDLFKGALYEKQSLDEAFVKLEALLEMPPARKARMRRKKG